MYNSGRQRSTCSRVRNKNVRGDTQITIFYKLFSSVLNKEGVDFLGSLSCTVKKFNILK